MLTMMDILVKAHGEWVKNGVCPKVVAPLSAYIDTDISKVDGECKELTEEMLLQLFKVLEDEGFV